jgi:hypothetical protein
VLSGHEVVFGGVMAVSSASRAQLGWAPSVRRMLAVSVGKAARRGTRRLGQRTGTPLPGLGQVVCGHGNNGDGTEGVILGNAVGTYLRGPCLPKNPALADFLIAAAVSRRYGVADLPPLADDLEEPARAESIRRAQETARSSRAKLRLPALDRGGLSRGRHAACPGGNEDLHYTGNAQSGANR